MTEQAENQTQTPATEQVQTENLTEQNVQNSTPNDVPNTQQPNDVSTQVEQVNTGIPESSDAYVVSIDGFDFESFKQSNGEVLKSFHDAGLNNDQLTAVVKAYDQHVQVNVDALQQEWGSDFQNQLNLAKHAVKAAGLPMDQIDSPTFGIRLAAWIGKQIQEDSPPSNTQQIGSEGIEQLMMSDAYSNANHPDHKSVASRVSQYFQSNYPE
ncbi:hypothetical protein [Acinetobacter sp. WCHAc060025]|uniref:hypothetical protein n=1 Tax=Acinetobacter sp. WCHAc060025 TaxID=2518625 RepID=UPI001023485D|nr:hypothetical protein [Acinetobacter sp. WCHAc060025]RZG74821.1 hypothetical protein EXE09_12605 [Acinetobacter sp. WCHAc060025]